MLSDQDGNKKPYLSRGNSWKTRATVRVTSPIILNSTTQKYFYPRSRQPLAIHPKIIELGQQAIHFVLIQTMYKFLQEVAYIETEIVNYSALNIANGKLPYIYSDELKQDMLTIMIDEVYHAYVAKDYLQQVIKHTQISPLSIAVTTELAEAIELSNLKLPTYLKDTFKLIAVCISENILTKELVSFAKEDDIEESFMQLMSDHLSDEGRHASIFSDVLNITWQAIPGHEKKLLAAALPEFILNYLSQDIQKNFAKAILKSLEFDQNNIDTIIKETYASRTLEQIKLSNPIINNIIALFERNNLLRDKDVQYHLQSNGLLTNLPTFSQIEKHSTQDTLAVIKGKSNTNNSGFKNISNELKSIIQLHSNSIAICYQNNTLSYEKLNQKIETIAFAICKDNNYKPQQLVAVYLPRGIDPIIAFLATLRSGCVYLPLDSNLPKMRLEGIITSSGVQTILTNKALSANLPDNIYKIIIDECHEYPEKPIEYYHANLDDNAYVIYTSGSTGNPKGVVVQHKALINLLKAIQHRFSIQSDDKVLQFAESSFDVSIAEILMTFLSGACLVIADSDEKKDPKLLTNLLITKEITIATLPPAFLAIMPIVAIPSLKKLIVTGDAANQKLLQSWQQVTQVINAYGPTESTIWASLAFFDNTTPYNDIGIPVDNTFLYVINENDQIATFDEIGELYIVGDGLALGYLNDIDKTEQVFLPNPFAEGTKFYRTGDQVKYTKDKHLLYLGRIDRQVKIRSFRVELAEIEQALMSHINIEQAAIILQKNQLDKEIICFYTTNKEDLTEYDIRQHLSKILPDYMIPNRFIGKTNLPTTTNGKINYQLLETEYINFANAKNLVTSDFSFNSVFECFKYVLQRADIDRTSNFFMQGGNSLQAIALINLINQRFGSELTVSKFMQISTIDEIENFLSNHERKKVSTIEEF